MRKEDCFFLGHISRKHGYKGEIIAVFDTDQNEKYRDLESILLLVQDELIPFFIEELAQNSKGHFILRLEDVESQEDAEALIGREIYLPLEVLPPLSGKAFYFHEVIGFEMVDHEKGSIGHCVSVNDQSNQPIFHIQNGSIEILIPAVDDFIDSINREEKKIFLRAPEGLIDIYLNRES
jgi:16S rRNA processing protein RimM